MILEREEGREIEKDRNIDVREKRQSVTSLRTLTRNGTGSLGVCPDGDQPATFGCMGRRSDQLSHPARAPKLNFLKKTSKSIFKWVKQEATNNQALTVFQAPCMGSRDTELTVSQFLTSRNYPLIWGTEG